jgi:hypothetical protein
MARRTLTVRVRLTSMPTWCDGPLSVGLQSGRDGILRGRPDGAGILFEGEVTAKPDRDGSPDFSGPLVHGRRGDRFLYVSWGVDRDGSHDMFGRLKLYLGPLSRARWEQPGLTWTAIETGAVVVDVEGKGPDGTPACGTARARWRPSNTG